MLAVFTLLGIQACERDESFGNGVIENNEESLDTGIEEEEGALENEGLGD